MNGAKQLEDAVFFTAVSLPDTEERRRFLNQACAGNAGLRAVVEEMLAAYDESEPFFAKGRSALVLPPEEVAAAHSGASETSTAQAPDEYVGRTVGRYKLLQRIGEGGCGVVYMAEQEVPVRRKVALKIIKLGMDTRSVIARFDAERQALALMDHPNIARVLDAGATETGRPFFVMELVRGFKITDYCDRNNLDTAQRLFLFIQVCHAIQHAHQKGIIHRDIKPSNILVTMHDGQPVPKVIDFGIAKAIEGRLTDQTLFTAYEQLIGTPAYMSPEQAEMSGLDVDTRSDVYSLGVLLYELLTGRTPFDGKELIKDGVDNMRRTLREQEPLRPSGILTTLHGTELTATAAHRHEDPPQLISLLKGDLDWIVMKALEKDRTRRYETANGLAMEVQRYLNNEPVVARPPSRMYRFRKLVRRNRAVFVSSVAVAVAVMMGLGAAMWMFVLEREARREQMRLRELAERAERREALLRQQAEAKEQINQAAIYVSQGRFEDANEILEQIRVVPRQPSFDGVAAYRRVGEWLALQQRWAAAAERFYPLMEIDKLDSWQVVTLDYQACGALLAECDDRERYGRFCQAAIDRFRSTTNGDMAGRILKTCLLHPAPEGLLEQLSPMAKVADEHFRAIPEKDFSGWAAIHLALWEYRRGNLEAADAWCRRGVNYNIKGGALNLTLRLISAMTFQRNGRTAEAAAELSSIREAIQQRFQQGFAAGEQKDLWYDWLFARILCAEAVGMRGGPSNRRPQ